MYSNSKNWLKVFIIGFVVLVVLFLLYYLLNTSLGLQKTTATSPTPTPIPTPTPNFKNFSGTWIGHGRSLTIAPDGHAQFSARAYQWCGPGVSPPCDSMQGDNIINGIIETVIFTRVDGSTAYGAVTSSNDGTVGKAVTLVLQPNDSLMFTDGTLLCGPQSPPGWCGA